VLIATTLLTVAVVTLLQLSLAASAVTGRARIITQATFLASQKLEQLRALAWAYDAFAQPVTDTSTDTALAPERSAGGTGLSPSPSGTLLQDTVGYCDLVDATGRVVGACTGTRAGAAFVRRWAIEPVTGDAIVIQVSVLPAWMAPGRGSARPPEEVRLVALKTRKAR
jgi:hypothetical protein